MILQSVKPPSQKHNPTPLTTSHNTIRPFSQMCLHTLRYAHFSTEILHAAVNSVAQRLTLAGNLAEIPLPPPQIALRLVASGKKLRYHLTDAIRSKKVRSFDSLVKFPLPL